MAEGDLVQICALDLFLEPGIAAVAGLLLKVAGGGDWEVGDVAKRTQLGGEGFDEDLVLIGFGIAKVVVHMKDNEFPSLLVREEV